MIDSQPSGGLARARRDRPEIVDARADHRFRVLARRRGLDPDARFVGGYVAWEWAHARHLFEGHVEGLAVLELGCNLGATAIVLAALGAQVTAIDPDPGWIEIARANAARHGLARCIHFAHVPDTTRLPFEDACFDVISCNSVLEYVPPPQLEGVLREADRVLVRGGLVAVLGTSNRLWPREQHSGRWLVNYVPRALDAFMTPPRRGISAASVRRVLRDYDDLVAADGGRRFVALKARMGAEGWKLAAVKRVAALAARAGVSPGVVGPTLTMLLRKR